MDLRRLRESIPREEESGHLYGIQPRGDFAGERTEGNIRQGQGRASPRTPGLPGEQVLLFAGNMDFLRIYK